MSTGLIKKLEKVLSATYGLYFKTQVYHWNIEGKMFYQAHLLLQTHYEDLALAVDLIAEKIVMLGTKVSINLDIKGKDNGISVGDENFAPRQMLEDLVKSHKVLIDILKDAVEEASDAKDLVAESILVDRVAFHEKAIWFIESMLKNID